MENLTKNWFSYWLYHVLWSTRNWQGRQGGGVAGQTKWSWPCKASSDSLSHSHVESCRRSKVKTLCKNNSEMGWKKDKFIAPKGQAPDSSQAYPYPCVRFEGPVCLTLGLQPKLLSAILIMASLKCRTRKMFANKGTARKRIATKRRKGPQEAKPWHINYSLISNKCH